jgi:hypothetical protein
MIVSKNGIVIFAPCMKDKKPYSTLQKASSLLMLLALAWLTVSLPFVYNSQQLQKELVKETKATPDDNSNPLANTTEEKTENGSNTLSEYLHEIHITEQPVSFIKNVYKHHPADLYIAFHPEYICPPPDVRAS